jgi:hypothetical protein
MLPAEAQTKLIHSRTPTSLAFTALSTGRRQGYIIFVKSTLVLIALRSRTGKLQSTSENFRMQSLHIHILYEFRENINIMKCAQRLIHNTYTVRTIAMFFVALKIFNGKVVDICRSNSTLNSILFINYR